MTQLAKPAPVPLLPIYACKCGKPATVGIEEQPGVLTPLCMRCVEKKR